MPLPDGADKMHLHPAVLYSTLSQPIRCDIVDADDEMRKVDMTLAPSCRHPHLWRAHVHARTLGLIPLDAQLAWFIFPYELTLPICPWDARAS
jgi:hypothetical protein